MSGKEGLVISTVQEIKLEREGGREGAPGLYSSALLRPLLSSLEVNSDYCVCFSVKPALSQKGAAAPSDFGA